MPYPLGNDQYAIADRNQRDALTAHSGTADTAEPRRVVAEDGALWTSIKSGTVQTSGTINVSGTIPVSGTVGVSGTIPVSGTVGVSGTLPVSGTVVTQRGLNIPIHDTVEITYPSGTTESYVFKSGGTAGATVATVSVTYSDSTKGSISLVLKT